MKKLILNIVSVVVSLAILVYMFFFVIDIASFLNAVGSINLFFLFLTMLTYFVFNIFASVRIYYLFGLLKVRKRFSAFFWANQLGMLLSNFTVGRVGYAFGGVAYLKQSEKIDTGTAFGVLSQIYVIELLMKAITATIGVLFLVLAVGQTSLFSWAYYGIIIIVVLVALFAMFFWFAKPQQFQKIFNFLPTKLQNWLEQTRETIQKIKSKQAIAAIVGVTILNWIMRGVEWFFISYALNTPLNFVALFLLHPLLTSTRFIPITIAGVGAFEATMIFGLGLFGVSSSTALLFAFVDRADNALVDLIALPKIRNVIK